MYDTSKTLTAVLAAIVLLAFLPGCTKREDRLVVTVGERGITVGEFEDAMARFMPGGVDGLDEGELRDLKRNLLNQLIEEELVVELARRNGIKVSQDELAAEVETIRAEFGEGELDSVILPRYGSVAKWKEEIRRKLLVRKVVDELITTSVKVSDEDALAYYEANIKDYVVPEQVRARMIVVETQQEAKGVRKGLKKKDFPKVAREVSISPEGDDGGDLGFFGRGDMPEEFEEVVFSLKVGKISDVVESPYGFHIFMVEEKREGRELGFEDVKERIIDKLVRKEADREFNKWISSLKKEVKIELGEDVL
jgi:parvulin-like peptidyl-prolyl isomerase